MTKHIGFEYNKWLIETKIRYTKEFDQRQLQLVSLIGGLIAITGVSFTFESDFDLFLMSLIILGELVLLFLYLDFAKPRKFSQGFMIASDLILPNLDFNLMANELDITLKHKAYWMRKSYLIFTGIVISYLLLTIIQIR